MSAVQVANAFLANYAEVRGGTLQALGAMPEWWAAPRLPHQIVAFTVLQLSLEREEQETVFQFSVLVHRPEGRVDPPSIQVATQRGVLGPDSRSYDPFFFIIPIPVPITLASEGRHAVEVRTSGHEPIILPFGVRVVEEVVGATVPDPTLFNQT